MKNHKRRMKTRLGTRTGQKTLKEESKRHPNTKERSESKGQFGTFGVLNGTLKGQNFLGWALAQQPLGDDKAHPFSIFFAKGCVRIHTLIVRAYFLESSDFYK